MTDSAPRAGTTEDSRLVRLMRVWERLGSWSEQDLFLDIGNDLCSYGRYLLADAIRSRVTPEGDRSATDGGDR